MINEYMYIGEEDLSFYDVEPHDVQVLTDDEIKELCEYFVEKGYMIKKNE